MFGAPAFGQWKHGRPGASNSMGVLSEGSQIFMAKRLVRGPGASQGIPLASRDAETPPPHVTLGGT
jgi:hypothetical protein